MENRLIINGISDILSRTTPAGTKVWLYGSRARGNARENSDWDLLILLDKASIDSEDFRNISYPLIEYGWKCGEDFSPQMYTTKEWKEMQITPYAQNIERDKKIVYES